jgi:hypothetical protein
MSKWLFFYQLQIKFLLDCNLKFYFFWNFIFFEIFFWKLIFFPGNVFFENDFEDIDFKTFGVLNIELWKVAY